MPSIRSCVGGREDRDTISHTRDGSTHSSMSPSRSNGDHQPGALTAQLLRAGLAAPSAAIRQTSVGVPDGIHWAHLCAVAYRCRIAPVLYQCFRRASATAPPDVLNWFRVQHYATVGP